LGLKRLQVASFSVNSRQLTSFSVNSHRLASINVKKPAEKKNPVCVNRQRLLLNFDEEKIQS
jgi:DNA polymerase III sliding clamp (beta) subunit (PCNA family)